MFIREGGCLTPQAICKVADGTPFGPSDQKRVDNHFTRCLDCRGDRDLMESLLALGVDPQVAIHKSDAPTFLAFMDESGSETPTWDDRPRRTLVLVSVLTTAAGARRIERTRRRLLTAYELPSETEIHANPCLLGKGEFSALSVADREQFLRDFLEESRSDYLFHHPAGVFKLFTPERTRQELARRGISQYGTAFLVTLFTVGHYLDRCLGAKFRLLYDAIDGQTHRNLCSVTASLRAYDGGEVHLRTLLGEPRPVDSKRCAAIQLADVIAHYHDRYYQLWYGKFEHQPGLEPHRRRIADVYDEYLRPKELPMLIRQLRELDWSVVYRLTIDSK